MKKKDNGQNELHEAVLNDDIEKIKTLISQIPSEEINLIDNYGFSPFHYSLYTGSLESVQIFVKSHLCDHHQISRDEKSNSLHYLAKRKVKEKEVNMYIEIVQQLVKRGVSLEAFNSLGETPLHEALIRSNFIFFETVFQLIPHNVQQPNKSGSSLIDYAHKVDIAHRQKFLNILLKARSSEDLNIFSYIQRNTDITSSQSSSVIRPHEIHESQKSKLNNSNSHPFLSSSNKALSLGFMSLKTNKRSPIHGSLIRSQKKPPPILDSENIDEKLEEVMVKYLQKQDTSKNLIQSFFPDSKYISETEKKKASSENQAKQSFSIPSIPSTSFSINPSLSSIPSLQSPTGSTFSINTTPPPSTTSEKPHPLSTSEDIPWISDWLEERGNSEGTVSEEQTLYDSIVELSSPEIVVLLDRLLLLKDEKISQLENEICSMRSISNTNREKSSSTLSVNNGDVGTIGRNRRLSYAEKIGKRQSFMLKMIRNSMSLDQQTTSRSNSTDTESHLKTSSSSVLSAADDLVNKHQLRILFLGGQGVGKTTLIRSFREKKKSRSSLELTQSPIPDFVTTSSSDDLEISLCFHNREKDSMVFRCWDFGKQTNLSSTHQLFLCQDSFYLLLVNVSTYFEQRQEALSTIWFWSRSIRAKCIKSPIFVVGTHIDHKKCTNEHILSVFNDISNEANNEIQFSAFSAISNKNCDGVQELKDHIIQVAFDKKILPRQIPDGMSQLVRRIQQIKRVLQKRHLPRKISWNNFSQILTECSISPAQTFSCVELLHNLGIITYYAHTSSVINTIVVLDPLWLSQILSSVIGPQNNYVKKGILDHKHLDLIWKAPEYPSDLHHLFLELMERFELLYNFTPNSTPLSTARPPSGEIQPIETEHQGPHSRGNLIRSQKEDLSKVKTEMNGYSLIPDLLSDEPPSTLNDVFKQQISQIVGRIYQFSFLPSNFFSRFMIRCFKESEYTVLCYWKYGIVFSYVKDPETKAFVSKKESTLQVRARGKQRNSLLHDLLTTVDTVKESWILDYEISVPCSCSVCAQSTPHLFSYHSLMNSFCLDERTVRCEKSQEGLDIVELVPEFALYTQVPNFTSETLTFQYSVGSGAFASVYFGTVNEHEVAIKKMKVKTPFTTKNISFITDFFNEVSLLSKLEPHPNIIQFKGICLQPLCILFEYIPGGSLFDCLSNPLFDLPLGFRFNVVLCLARALVFLHGSSIIHRDVKSPNVLISSLDACDSSFCKLTDFGISRHFGRCNLYGGPGDNHRWLAPEILNREPYTELVDVYAYGMVVWEVFTQELPFEEFNEKYSSVYLIQEAIIKRSLRPTIPSSIPQNISRIVKKCWRHNPKTRPSMQQILEELSDIKISDSDELIN